MAFPSVVGMPVEQVLWTINHPMSRSIRFAGPGEVLNEYESGEIRTNVQTEINDLITTISPALPDGSRNAIAKFPPEATKAIWCSTTRSLGEQWTKYVSRIQPDRTTIHLGISHKQSLGKADIQATNSSWSCNNSICEPALCKDWTCRCNAALF